MSTHDPYVNHVALSLDGAHMAQTMAEMRWKPEPMTEGESA